MSLILYIYIYIYIYHHYHHVVPQARISLTLSRHFSLSFIASGRSSRPHPESRHSSWMYVRARRPAFARPYVGVHRSTSLMSSSLLLQPWPACLVHLTCIVFVMGGRWPYSWSLVGCCRLFRCEVELLSIFIAFFTHWIIFFTSPMWLLTSSIHPVSVTKYLLNSYSACFIGKF